ncbi:MAG: carbohydrate-binding domain-containing protein [Clostridia bacterium]|nr:carbohydrate-binding domain-containing protein [Clostridia bacterium]
MKRNLKYFLILLCLSLCLVGCSNNSSNDKKIDNSEANIHEEIDVDINTQIESALETIENMKGEDFENLEVNVDTFTNINLNGSNIEVSGSGVNVENNVATIITAGTYCITGSIEDGQIIVDAGDNNVTLALNNATIKSKTSSPIYIKSAKNTVIYLEEGSENYIEDATTYTYQNTEETETDSAIFSKDDLYMTGTGLLNVKANYNDAIKSKDDFAILNGTYIVNSVDDGIIGKDSVSIKNGNITINASGDGIKTTNTEDTSKGYIAIENGTFNIVAQSDGIQAETDINIADGNIKITTGGGSEVSSNNINDDRMMGKRRWGEWETKLDEEDTQSAKGIKANNNLTILSGTFNIDSSDDSIHCNNNIVVSSGDISILAGDDGIHADNYMSITGGNISIDKSYEGIESSVIKIKNGNISIVASDDGINVAGGNDGSAINGRLGQNSFSSNSNNYLSIENGNIYVNATGDGLDANGSIYIKGGKVEVAGPTNSGNGALDYDRECSISGGDFIAYGARGMSQNPSSSSTQNILSINGDYSSSEVLKIKHGNEEIYTCTFKKNCQSVIISTESIKTGEEYVLVINDEEIETFEISSLMTNIGSNGDNGIGGMNGKGEMNREPGKMPNDKGGMRENFGEREMNFSGEVDRRK